MLLTTLFDRMQSRARSFRLSDLADDDVYEEVIGGGGLRATTGERVSTQTALSIAPVWAAVSIISGGCAKIPMKVYRRRPTGGGKDVDYSHPIAKFTDLDEMANDETPAYELLRRCYVSALLHNNGYIWADWSPTGQLLGLYNLLPDRTAAMRHKGKLWYVTETNGQLYPMPADDVIHLRGIGVCDGDAPELIRSARDDFGLMLAARKFTSLFFKNGAHLGGVLQLPPGYKKDVRRKHEKALEEQRSGTDKAFKTFVVREGYKWFSTSVEPDKAQTIELNDEKRRDVANWFCMAPSRLGVKGSVSYNSLEHDRQDLYDTTLSNWLIPMGAQVNTKLRTPSERQTRSVVVRHQVSALLWADAETRNNIACKGIQAGRFSPDETRGWDDLNPRDDGEGSRFLRPANMQLAGDPIDEPTDDKKNKRKKRNRKRREQRGNVTAAVQGIFRAEVRRVGRRLATQAERAQQRNQLPAWLDEFESKNREHVESMLVDAVGALNALDPATTRSATSVADCLFSMVKLRGGALDDSFPDALAEDAAQIFKPE